MDWVGFEPATAVAAATTAFLGQTCQKNRKTTYILSFQIFFVAILFQ
jgi:hypothetical protein